MKIAAGCLGKLPPAATTAVLGSGRDLNTSGSEKRATFHGKIMTNPWVIELDDEKIYRKALYLMVKTMVSCRFSLKPTQ